MDSQKVKNALHERNKKLELDNDDRILVMNYEIEAAERMKECRKKILEESRNAKVVLGGASRSMPLEALVFESSDEDPFLKNLKQDLDECTKKSAFYKGTVIAVGVSIPLSFLMKTYAPLFLGVFLGGGADFYFAFNNCKKERTVIDEYMMLRKKLELNMKKELLKTEFKVWTSNLQKHDTQNSLSDIQISKDDHAKV